MANVILPIASVCLTLGGTFNIFSYETGRSNCNKSIFHDTDFTENAVDILNSTYYVFEGGKLPYSAMGLPIDLVRKFKSYNYFPSSETTGVPGLLRDARNPDLVVLLIGTEYRKAERSVKDNALPISNWQESVPKTQTHYAEKMHYGSRCIAMAEIMTKITGDTQVVHRILTDVMGSSGPIGEDTVDTWRNALRAARESPDVRGDIYFKSFTSHCQNTRLPNKALLNLEEMLEVLPNIKSLTNPYDREQRTTPISVSFKPLEILDDEYPAAEKKKKSEEYLVSLDKMIDDLESTSEKFRPPHRPYTQGEDRVLLYDFEDAADNVIWELKDLVIDGRKNGGEISLYEDLDEIRFEEAFKNYYAGLYKTEKSYYSSLKRLYEDIGTVCDRFGFLKPTSGVLLTSEDEVLNVEVEDGNGEDHLDECQQNCLRNDRCRAAGFDNVQNQCRIYYRSTKTAKIDSHGEVSSFKVYDRMCTKK